MAIISIIDPIINDLYRQLYVNVMEMTVVPRNLSGKAMAEWCDTVFGGHRFKSHLPLEGDLVQSSSNGLRLC